MEELRNMLAVIAVGRRYDELDGSTQEYIIWKANYLRDRFDGQISDTHHVITYAAFKGWL